MKPIEVQISARVQAPRNGRRITEGVIRQAIERYAGTLEPIPGIDLRIVRWRHGKANPWHTATNSTDEWAQFARFLQSGEAEFRIRIHEAE